MAGLCCHSLRKSILLVHLLLLYSSETQLIGPKQPIIATAGEDVTLPCHLLQVENVATRTLEWTRPDLDPRFVLVWRAGQDFINAKNPAYKGRASLFTDELKHGNISLKLSKVKPVDEGRYTCHIPYKSEEAFIDLIVGAVSSPVINLEGIDRDNEGVILECKSEGWHPKPEVHWLDGEGNVLPAGPTETLIGPGDLYTVISRVTVEKRCGNNFTCRVEQKNINQSRETHIHISDDFFMFKTSSAAPVYIGLAVCLAVSISVILIGVFFIWRQNKTKVKRDHCDESEKQEMTNRSENDKTETDQEQEKLMTQNTLKDRLTAEVEKLKDEKQQLQNLLDAKEQKHKPLLLEKNQEADKKLKNIEDLNQQLKKKDAEIRELKEQLEKHQEADKEMKEETEKLKSQLEKNSSGVKEQVKQPEKLKENIKELNQQLEEKDAEIRELKKQSESSKLNKPQPDDSQRHFQEQNQSSSANHSSMSGDIILEKVDFNGSYLCLKNISSEDKLMEGWKLKLQINQTESITYKFEGNYTLKAGRVLTLRKPGDRNPNTDTDDLVWVGLDDRPLSETQKIFLISNTGEQHRLQ